MVITVNYCLEYKNTGGDEDQSLLKFLKLTGNEGGIKLDSLLDETLWNMDPKCLRSILYKPQKKLSVTNPQAHSSK